MKPITPAEVIEIHKDNLPPEVIEAFNELILENWDGHRASIKQTAVAKLIVSKMELKSDDII